MITDSVRRPTRSPLLWSDAVQFVDTSPFLPLVEWADVGPFTTVHLAQSWSSRPPWTEKGSFPDIPHARRLEWAVLCHLKSTAEKREWVWRFVEGLIGRGGLQDEDLAQAARLHIFEHIRNRYPGWRKGYLETALRNFYRSAARKRSAELRRVRRIADGDTPARIHNALASPDVADVVAEAVAAEALVALVARLKPVLTPREAQVFEMRLAGLKDSEIGQRLGRRTQTVNALGRRIAAKARRLK